MVRRLVVLLLVALVVAAVVVGVQRGPRLRWERATPHRALDVLIVDKTVADRSYREHAGLVFLLNHWRTGPSADEPIDAARDYVGVRPSGDDVREVAIDPAPRSVDLAYVADTYGVYDDDLAAHEPTGERSELRFGGITVDEVERVRAAVRPGGTLVAEFNTFASPTRPDARAALGELVGVRWTGWIGRHFADLERDSDELPAWLVPGWEQQERRDWSFSGGGYVLVHEDGRLVVLREPRDIARAGVRIHRARSAGVDGLPRSTVYDYWFDVVEARAGAEVVAEYRVAVTDAGARLLDDAGIPERFPAVVHRPGDELDGWYFAGDFADLDPLPERFDRRGVVADERERAEATARDDQRRFFWGTYAPLLEHVVARAHENRPTS